jgi:hypothetical protein
MSVVRRFESRIVIVVLIAAIAADLFIYSFKKDYRPINGDGKGYYLSLPACLIHADISYEKLIQSLRNHPDGEYARIDDILKTHPVTGRLINKYSIGTALLLLPFFLIAHGIALFFGLEPDGFSLPYQWAVSLGALFYLTLGIFYLVKLLRQRFPADVSAWVLAVILFGTNLLYYGTYEAAYSHVYSFFLFCLFVHAVSRWHETFGTRYAVLMGTALGLIALVRVPNLLMLLFPLLYAINARSDIPVKPDQWRRHLPALLLAGAIAALLFFPQLLIWRQGAGAWFINPYIDEHFDFTHPHFWGVLFGAKQGLFFYSPLLLLSLAGIFMAPFRRDRLFLPIVVFLAGQTFLIASWHCWWLGASWGHRGFTESLSLLAIPMGYAITALRAREVLWRRLRWLLFPAMAVNILAMFWYWSSLGLPPGWGELPLVRYFQNRL